MGDYFRERPRELIREPALLFAKQQLEQLQRLESLPGGAQSFARESTARIRLRQFRLRIASAVATEACLRHGFLRIRFLDDATFLVDRALQPRGRSWQALRLKRAQRLSRRGEVPIGSFARGSRSGERACPCRRVTVRFNQHAQLRVACRDEPAALVANLALLLETALRLRQSDPARGEGSTGPTIRAFELTQLLSKGSRRDLRSGQIGSRRP